MKESPKLCTVEQWNPTNLQDREQNRCSPKLTKTTLQAKDILRRLTKFWFTNLFPPQAMKIPDAKAAVDKEQKKLETNPAWDFGKVKSKKEVILEAQRGKTSPLCCIDGHTSPQKTRSWNHSYSSMKAEWCSGGDSVKDDSGAYAVFPEQGSSASQMSAAKIMDVIARLPGCHWQAADAVSAYTQVKLEDAPNCSEFPNRNVQMFGCVFHDTNGHNHEEKLKIPWYLLNETCTVID